MKKIEIELTNVVYEYLKRDLEEYFKKRYKMDDITIEDLAAAIVSEELLELHHEK